MVQFSLVIVGIVFLFGPSANQLAASSSEPSERLFTLRVLPLLEAKCFGCHGGQQDDIKGQLDLTSRASVLRGGESGDPAIVPGRPDESLLIEALLWEGLEMPPKASERLTEKQTEWFRLWIAGGAAWPNPSRRDEIQKTQNNVDGVVVATSGGLTPTWTDRRYKPEDLWAYQPLNRPPTPAVAGDSGNPIDAFLYAGMQALGVSPAPAAGRHALIRRATFDLTGLPPEPKDMIRFVSDPAPENQAFAKVVDRLLDSPHYGEHWARHWLDITRYADSSGLANDYQRPHTWRYRDYVVRSLNDDKPYDQFVREQIAGDEIDPEDPEMLIAVGFLRLGPWELTGMEVPKIARQRFLDDVTDSVGQVFLSHPLQCARCHDHKFDPIPTRDYYRLQAVFATTQFAERAVPFLDRENTAGFGQRQYLLRRKKHYEQMQSTIHAKQQKAEQQWYAERGQKWVARAQALKRGVPEDMIPPRHLGLSAQDLGLERIARKGLERLVWELDRYQPYAFSVYDGLTRKRKSVVRPLRLPAQPLREGELEETAILAGGDPFSPTVPVTPGVLSVLSRLASSGDITQSTSISSEVVGRRAELARWIASSHNPLAVRSIVNRIWHWHFGRGIAETPNNFGAMGRKPTHPRLLDWLAVTFVEQGWSLKKMHRLIMASDAYQRGSCHPNADQLGPLDPHGSSYAVFRARRVTAEQLRDSMLAVSGELNRRLGGIPARPEMNSEVALQPRQVMGTFASAWQPSPLPSQRHRRSLYLLQLRGLRDPLMAVFNQPSPDSSCAVRSASTITPQVFGLFNSTNSYDRALAFAARLLKETDGGPRAVKRAFWLAYGRPPTREQTQTCLDHWDRMTARHEALVFAAPEYPRQVRREAVEENSGQKFTFVEPLEVYDDFRRDLKPCDLDARTRGLSEVCLVLLNSNEFIYID